MAMEQTVPRDSFARRLADRSPFFNAVRLAVRPLRWKVAGLKAWVLILAGGLYHWLRGVTPKSSHFALVTLFMHHGGRANDFFARMVAALHPPYALPPAEGVLGALTPDGLAQINQKLELDGYYVFPDALSPQMCESIVQQTLGLNLQLMGDEAVAEAERRGVPAFARFDRAAPKAAQYSLTRDDTTDIAEVQQLISDPSIIAVAQNYLRSKPIFTGIYMGWSAAVKDTPDANAAQEFHWDMERIRWLRFFIYLTDVGTENGPHCFIRGSHCTGAIPQDLLELGYVRHRDETIIQRFGRDSYREFVGRKGTIIAEDSRGLHKGKMPVAGDRLLLAFEVSNTTFGANKRHLIRNIRVPRLAVFAKSYPRVYENLDFAEPL
jgi:phytanoyl-CoA dioxygenase PhyH